MKGKDLAGLVGGITATVGVIALAMWGLPQYGVYRKELAGKAELQQADWNRQIAIREAEARLEAEMLNAKSEVARAKGMAEANKIVGDSLQGKEEYLRYLWIQKLGENNQDVIYIPTEAGIPILEATRSWEYKPKAPAVK